MSAARRKKRLTLMIGIIVILVPGILYYFLPFWWESYRYENDQVKVRINDASGRSMGSSLAGTLVVRITGVGMERCGWGHSGFKTVTGSANGTLLAIDSISSQFTDDEGIASVPPYQGIGRGRRGFMAGCQFNRGFLLLISRPGYATERETPRFDKVNASGHVIRPPRPRRETTPAFEYARDRIRNELQLLYPGRINSSASRPEEEDARHALMSMAEYWNHKLPDGQTIRSYAIDTLKRVNAGLACPRLQAGIRSIFSDTMIQPVTEAKVLAEHNALREALAGTAKGAVASCEIDPV